MEARELILNGRKYLAYISPDEQRGAHVIIGPKEGLVDSLGLPEPIATNLHNALYDRKLFSYSDIVANQRNAVGALQEVLNLDAQRLVQAFFEFENEKIMEAQNV